MGVVRSLTLEEARQKARGLLIAGFCFRGIAFAAVLVLSGSVLYHILLSEASKVFIPVLNPALRALQTDPYAKYGAWLYNIVYVDVDQMLSIANAGLLFRYSVCFACLAFGAALSQSGKRLVLRIKRAEESMQEVSWVESGVLRSRHSEAPIVVYTQRNDDWYTRPWGLVAIGVTISLIGAWLSKLLHLA